MSFPRLGYKSHCISISFSFCLCLSLSLSLSLPLSHHLLPVTAALSDSLTATSEEILGHSQPAKSFLFS